MTRDFNKQRRDDPRPSFRKQSPNGPADARSPRPARPRLNRETVDRAWESGAQTNHADYHPRTTGGQSPNRGTGNGRYPNRDSQHTAYGNDGNRRDPSRNHERSFDKGPEPRSFEGNREGNRRNFDGPRPQNARNYSQGPRARDARNVSDGPPARRPGGYRHTEPGEPRNTYRSPDQRQGYPPRDGTRDSLPGRGKPWEKRASDAHNGPQRERGPRPDNRRPPYASEQRNARPPERDSFRPRRPAQGQFEGDYEGSANDEKPERAGPGARPHAHGRFEPPRASARSSEAQEHHVTRLPDGRVLKGPRPAQRKNAQFWTGIAADKDELLDHVQTHAAEVVPSDEPENAPHAPELEPERNAGTDAQTPRRPRPRAASAVVRSKKATKASRPAGPKPSRPGFKWPTP